MALFFVTTLGCVLTLEFAVRLIFPYFAPSGQVPFRLNADGVPLGPAGQTVRQATPKGDYDALVQFNADGLRDRKTLSESKASDWFAIGDSFTMGWGVDEDQRYSNQLERLFQTNGFPTAVYNVAIPENILGYGKLLRYAESRGAKVRHLIVGVCMENDIRDYKDGQCDWDPAAAKMALARASWKETLRAWLKRHSAVYAATSFALQRSPTCRRVLERFGIARDVSQLSGESNNDEAALLSSRDSLVKLVGGYDAVILIIPSRRLWAGKSTEVENQVHEHFTRLLREANLKVVDTRPGLQTTGHPLECYFATDPHWNAHGHAIAAQELFKILVTKAAASETTLSTSQIQLP